MTSDNQRQIKTKIGAFDWKIFRKVFLFLILMLEVLSIPAFASGRLMTFASENNESVLLVYHTTAEYQSISKVISACGETFSAVQDTAYEPGEAKNYTYLITTSSVPIADARKYQILPMCIGKVDSCSPKITYETKNSSTGFAYDNFYETASYVENLPVTASYLGTTIGEVTLSMGRKYPFSVSNSDAVVVPYFQSGNLSEIMLSAVMNNYFGKKSRGHLYAMVDEIYPFSDLEMFVKLADAMYDNGIPFIASLMPVYDNLDYPSFQRYMEILKYIQARNGTFIIHDPIVKETEFVREPIDIKMQRFYQKMDENHIHYFDKKNTMLSLDMNSLEKISSQTRNFGSVPVDTVIVLNIPEKEEEIDQIISRLNAKWLTLGDYKTRFTTENYQYVPSEIQDTFTYQEKAKVSYQNFFNYGNKFLVIVVGISLIIFTGLLIIGIKYYRKKFFRR